MSFWSLQTHKTSQISHRYASLTKRADCAVDADKPEGLSTTVYYDSCGQLSRQQFYTLDLRMASGGLWVSHTAVHGVQARH